MKNLCFRAASACSPYKPGLSQEEQMLLFTLPGDVHICHTPSLYYNHAGTDHRAGSTEVGSING